MATADPGSEIAKLVEGCGICVDHNNVEAFATAIRELILDAAERNQMRSAARTRALNYFRQDVVLKEMQAEISAPQSEAKEPALPRPLRRPSF